MEKGEWILRNLCTIVCDFRYSTRTMRLQEKSVNTSMSIKETTTKPTTRHRIIISSNIIKQTAACTDDDDEDDDDDDEGEGRFV